MKSNILFKGTVLIISLLLFYSCSQDTMDKINANPNNPTDVASKYIITDVMTSTAFNCTGADLNFYASVYMEHNVGIYGQMYDAEFRHSSSDATTYDNSWAQLYSNLLDLKTVIKKCSPGGSEAGNVVTLGIAQVLTAYNLAMLTDLFGNVPWTEACQPGVIFTPKVDNQSDIYVAINKMLDDGITNLKATATYPSLGIQDFIYAGNATKWTKAAYGLKARYAARLAFRTPNWAAVISNAALSFASATDEFSFTKYDGNIATNPGYAFFTDRDYFGSSLSMSKITTARNDPRAAKFFVKYPGSTSLVFAPNGTNDQIQGKYGISGLLSPTQPTFLMSYHELKFLVAEAYARSNDIPNAQIALKDAISAAFVSVGFTATDASNYYTASVAAKFTANPLQEIMVQKYLSFYDQESIEAYNDYRRLKAMGNNFITLDNPNNLLTNYGFPLRYAYGKSDLDANPNVATAYAGVNVFKDNVWWAGGTK